MQQCNCCQTSCTFLLPVTSPEEVIGFLQSIDIYPSITSLFKTLNPLLKFWTRKTFIGDVIWIYWCESKCFPKTWKNKQPGGLPAGMPKETIRASRTQMFLPKIPVWTHISKKQCYLFLRHFLVYCTYKNFTFIIVSNLLYSIKVTNLQPALSFRVIFLHYTFLFSSYFVFATLLCGL